MEPIDDILIPRTQQPDDRRLRSRHVLRALAVVLMAAALAYAGKVLKLDSNDSDSIRKVDLLSAVPFFLFGAILWWYAGRKVDEFSRPLFRSKDDAPSDVRVDKRNFFWLGASLVSGLVGMSSVIIGGIFAWRGELLRKALPGFFAKLEASLPQLRNLELAPTPLIVIGVLLVLTSGVALGLAMRRRTRTA